MAAALALASALVYGAGDFIGGVASRRLPPIAVVWRSNAIGLVGLLAILPFFLEESPSTADLLWGAGAGLAGGMGILLLYSGMAFGTMSVVAPLTALLAAVVPVVVGFVGGERPSALAALGVVVAFAAIALVSREHDGERHIRVETRVLAYALGAGLGFGVFFVGLDAAADDVGLWPLIAARTASVTMFCVLVAMLRSARLRSTAAREGSMPALIVVCGLFDASANALYLLATQRGLLTLVAVLTSLYPASTVVLARVVLGERLSRSQLVGVGLAGAAVIFVTAG
jgi:drug/metabolite transporter (DMT)-like permease